MALRERGTNKEHICTFRDLLVSLRQSRIICLQESANLQHATNQRSECQNNLIQDLLVVLTVNQVKVAVW